MPLDRIAALRQTHRVIESESIERYVGSLAHLASTLVRHGDELMCAIVDRAIDACGASAGVVAVVHGDTALLECFRGHLEKVVATFEPQPLATNSPITEAARTRNAVWVESLDERLVRYPALVDIDTGSVASASIPAFFEDRVVGVLSVSHPAAHHFDDLERATLRAMAAECGATIGLRRAIERGRQWDAIAASKVLGLLAGEGVRITDANDTFLDLIGYSRAELDVGIDWWAITPPEYQEADAAGMVRLRAGLPVPPLEKEYLRPDGRRVPVLIGGALVSREPFRWVSVAIDISVRRHLEDQLSDAIDCERASHHRFAQVSEVIALMAAALTPAEVVKVLVERGVTATEALAGSLHLLEPGGTLVLAASHDGPDTPGPEHKRVDIPADLPFAEAIRTRRLVVAETTGHATWALVPVISGGQVVGILGLSFEGPPSFSSEDQELLATLAAAAGQALLRAQALEATASVATELQRALLPTVLPSHPSIRTASLYSAAPGPVQIGGDWYDIALGTDDMLFIIGDVAGHGIEAAKIMAAARHGLAALAVCDRQPGTLLGNVNTFLCQSVKDGMTTCIVLRYVPSERTLSWAIAGHPPALLISNGAASYLNGPVGPPLGIDPDASYPPTTLTLPPGSTVVLYTDGLIERRGIPLDESFEALRIEAADLHDCTSAEIVDRLQHRFGSDAIDDSAILVIGFADHT